MTANRLRVYYGPETEVATQPSADKADVTLPVEELLPLLADAYNAKRTWLADFDEDEITISTDLYEVLLAYQHHFRRPSA
jgi:hypothetical protein